MQICLQTPFSSYLSKNSFILFYFLENNFERCRILGSIFFRCFKCQSIVVLFLRFSVEESEVSVEVFVLYFFYALALIFNSVPYNVPKYGFIHICPT